MSYPSSKKSKNETNDDISREAKTLLDKILGDVSKKSATKQIIIGASSGWVTGFLASKVGKAAAFALGGGIIILQVAAHQGYIKINWDKVQKKAEKISDKVEEAVSGEGPNVLDKMERFVDKKVNKAGKLLKEGEIRTRRWYNTLIGDSECRFNEFHFFLVSFAVGVTLGAATAN